ncbi:MAG: hypothetical protein JNN13_10485 [Planctomycetes bacterium]|nr:hypothetical protein [Planctomycetota bacterium]MBZ0152425.1 hypothetical protein [Planctomycetota bacterium]MCC7399216.1 hypothetical protein [Planctomycetota bacterium]
MDIKLNRGMPGMPSLPPNLPVILMVLGAMCAGFGLLLLFNEWLLRWLVAGIFIVIGALLFLTAMRARRMLG